jgi:hypothetical protein
MVMQGVKIDTFQNFKGGELDLSNLNKGFYVPSVNNRIQTSFIKE